MSGWILLVVLIGHIGGSGAQPMTSSALPMATHEACEAAASDIRKHMEGQVFNGGNVADVITLCEPTGSVP